MHEATTVDSRKCMDELTFLYLHSRVYNYFMNVYTRFWTGQPLQALSTCVDFVCASLLSLRNGQLHGDFLDVTGGEFSL